jgi:hypothetical protein
VSIIEVVKLFVKSWLFSFVLLTLTRGDQPSLVEIKMAAERGNASAQRQLGDAYRSQFNYSEAAKWYGKAAAVEGDPEMLCTLAGLYIGGARNLRGDGVVPKKPKWAIELYTLAAAQGYTRAMHYLGTHYKDGGIVKRDKVKAYQMFRLSEKEVMSKGYMNQLILEMSETEIHRGDELAAAFKSKPFKGAFDELVGASLHLDGVMAVSDEKIAVISGEMLEPGKEGQIEVAGIPVKIRCESISKDSAVITFNEQQKVLRLKN